MGSSPTLGTISPLEDRGYISESPHEKPENSTPTTVERIRLGFSLSKPIEVDS